MMWPYALAVAALLGGVGAEPVSMKFTTVGRGDRSRIEEPRTAVARTRQDWESLWKAHAIAGKPPAVDLSKSMVLAVFLGTRPTAGYSVEIIAIEEQATGLVVTYRESAPPADAMVAQMLTTPFHIVRTESRTSAVTFKRVK